MKHLLCLLAAVPSFVLANTYDAAKNQLTIDAITVNGVVYQDVVVTVGNIVSIGKQSAADAIQSTPCQESNFTTAKASAIKQGMTLVQVNAVIGCTNAPAPLKYNTASAITYVWSVGPFSDSYNGRAIWVYIDPNTGKVAPMFGTGGGFFAGWQGF